MSEYPTNISDFEQWLHEAEPGIRMLEAPLPSGLTAHANIDIRTDASRMIVFLPGASGWRSKKIVPFFHRWQWHGDFPDAHVIALSDPAIGVNDRIIGGWFMHAEVDLIAELATMVRRIADRLDVAYENITLHGSSLGGYGAIGMAAHVPGSRAIAEIPQIDVAKWPVPSSMELLEELVGEPLEDFRVKFPERVALLDRLRFAKVVPPMTLITNATDPTYDLQVEFMDQLPTLAADCEVIGDQRLLVTKVTSGHAALPKAAALSHLAGR